MGEQEKKQQKQQGKQPKQQEEAVVKKEKQPAEAKAAAKETQDSKSATNPAKSQKQRLEELEAKAVDKAKATADAAFRPTATMLNASTSSVLLQAVDGPSLRTYQGKESVYVGRSVPVVAGGKLQVPIQVTTPGSVVEYSMEVKGYDIGFGITAEREEGVTIVREVERVDISDGPVKQKFLVGTVPCMVQFQYDNEYSWFREKAISYKITVTPPSKDSLAAGRRRRAQACLKAVEDDLTTAVNRYNAAHEAKTSLEDQVKQLEAELVEKKKSLQVAEKEESWLQARKTLRLEQQKLLMDRLENGWDDEKEEPVTEPEAEKKEQETAAAKPSSKGDAQAAKSKEKEPSATKK